MRFNKVTINNIEPRRDINGSILDAHGGAHFNWFNNRYYNYGVHYENRDKFMPGFTFACYSSEDFINWQYHGKLFGGDPPVGYYYRPHVLYNNILQKYVLWFLYFSQYGSKYKGDPDPRYFAEGAQKGVALSDSPEGPFEIQNIGIPLSYKGSGDHDLFLDDDGIAYIIYTSHAQDFKIFIDKLSPDFLSSTGETCSVDPHESGAVYPTKHPGCEAPALFKRKGIYYALFGSRTDRGKEGGGLRSYMADKPLGPYTYIDDINRDDQGNVIIPSQQNTVVPIYTQKGIKYIWAGDKWETMPALGDSFQHWQLLEFRNDGTIKRLKPITEWSMNIRIAE